jgi:hypothetical protein
VIQRLTEVAERYPRYGFKKLVQVLRRQGYVWNHKLKLGYLHPAQNYYSFGSCSLRLERCEKVSEKRGLVQRSLKSLSPLCRQCVQDSGLTI